jgi:hypothetical protein
VTALINSKAAVCNLATSRLGNFGSVNNIDIPSTPLETTFALVYDVIRQDLITTAMPNFALQRRLVAKETAVPAFGWSYQYEYPVDCLKVLGIGPVSCKTLDYSVEGGVIMSNTDYTSAGGMPLRFLGDIEDLTSFNAQFINLFALFLADAVAMAVTQDSQKAQMISQALPFKLASTSANQAQENRPIRISNSRYQAARFVNQPSFVTKE